MDADDDPVIASYDIFITDSQISRYLLQYPDRQSTQPYNQTNHQKPTELRYKPHTRVVEVDVPVNTRANYDERKGMKFGNALAKSRVVNDGGSLGLAGGFNAAGVVGNVNTKNNNNSNKDKDIIMAEGEGDGYGSGDEMRTGAVLSKQTLGGRIVEPVDGDPIYMLGAFRESMFWFFLTGGFCWIRDVNRKTDELHLSPVTGIVQLRSQLHHLDAVDELSLRAKAASKGSRGGGDDDPTAEARAIDMKVVRPGEKSDTGGQSNNELLKKMQNEKWVKHGWVDENEESSWDKYEEFMFNKSAPLKQPTLEAAISAEDYIDTMSAPRVDPIQPEFAIEDMKKRRQKRLEAAAHDDEIMRG